MEIETTNVYAPIFNIKAVVNQTGLNPATIRAWERRYGLPQPQRTDGGHRQYSQRDIETLKWLIARQDEGISISRAVKLLRSSMEQGVDPFESDLVPSPEPTILTDRPFLGEQIDELRQAWVSSCLAFDRKAAEQVLAKAFAIFPAETVCFELLQKALVEVGDGWHQGKITVQQEHFTSALSVQRMQMLIAAVPPPTHPERIIVANAPNDFHTFVSLLITYMIRRQGWDVIYLGADVPIEELVPTVRKIKPDLVIISAQLLHTAATLVGVARVLSQQGVPMAYGGGVFNYFPELRKQLPGHFLGSNLQGVVKKVGEILRDKQPIPLAAETPAIYRQALDQYMEKRPSIEARVLAYFDIPNFSKSQLISINQYLAQDIIAALKLGNLELINPDFDWVVQLLNNHNIPQETLASYLQAYSHAAAEELDESAAILKSWLADVAVTAD